jgi:hypothetical protein
VIRSALRLLLAVLIAVLAGIPIGVGAQASGASASMVYTYDGHHHSARTSHATAERSPPTNRASTASHNAIDRFSRGAAPHPEVPRSYAHTPTARLLGQRNTPGLRLRPATPLRRTAWISVRFGRAWLPQTAHQR